MRFLFSFQQGRFGRPAIFLVTALVLSACSIYRSDGRKFLEKQAFEYAGVEAFREDCHTTAETAGLVVIQADTRAAVLALVGTERSPSRMRVAPLGDRPYTCDYGFTTSQQMTSNIEHAVEQTVDLMRSNAN